MAYLFDPHRPADAHPARATAMMARQGGYAPPAPAPYGPDGLRWDANGAARGVAGMMPARQIPHPWSNPAHATPPATGVVVRSVRAHHPPHLACVPCRGWVTAQGTERVHVVCVAASTATLQGRCGAVLVHHPAVRLPSSYSAGGCGGDARRCSRWQIGALKSALIPPESTRVRASPRGQSSMPNPNPRTPWARCAGHPGACSRPPRAARCSAQRSCT